MTSISEKKIKSEFSRSSLHRLKIFLNVFFYYFIRSSRVKRTDPRVKRLRAFEDLKEQTLIEAEIDRFRMRSSQYVDNDGQQGVLHKFNLQLHKHLIFLRMGKSAKNEAKKKCGLSSKMGTWRQAESKKSFYFR